ncbi:extradiol ring-cleavage dioxygenase [Noviherbaspirillum sp. Root189]|uniref:DODA-type extradiol aromatic ring-opening family dioxygenase n=1 Tax=Noviherbaspirillum sp. Root189 TaxID=1736487 RepID=UPI00070A91B4|nr:extradiol ring-cleavage dioxygenase [Noviherbaspirillum sp. Root189]KRB83480.1 extradiol ring-cleavage dioxygenase [Noviherbaspirillum sp. Root189]
MAEILGLGLSHYPPLCTSDEKMGWLIERTLKDPGIPADAKDSAQWPTEMQAEWGNDRGAAAAAKHRAALVENFVRVRQALDQFKPDVVVIWGDDQYENFKEDIVPAFSILAYDDIDLYPWRHAQQTAGMGEGRPNVWNEGPDKHYRIRGNRAIAKYFASKLIESNIDVAYAYKPLHHESLAHAFTNAILYLDYERKLGWDYPTICFPVNCYGKSVICARGSMAPFGKEMDFDPPSPSPARLMEVGRATARIFRDSPWRVALIASSSWSHAFLVDHTWHLRPDTEADRRLYKAMTSGDYQQWQNTSLSAFEHAGQQEVLNWCALLGAMQEIGAELKWSDFVETHTFNSNKVFAVYNSK